MNKSPFAVATAAAPLPAATPNFAKDLYIANAARTADGDLVTVASTTDKNFKKYLSTKTTVDGYSVPSIEWSDKVGANQSDDQQGRAVRHADVQSGAADPAGRERAANAVAAVTDANAGAAATANAVATSIAGAGATDHAAASAVPQQVPAPNAMKQPPGVPGLPTPPPRTRGTIQRNPGQAPAASASRGQAPVVTDE